MQTLRAFYYYVNLYSNRIKEAEATLMQAVFISNFKNNNYYKYKAINC